MRSDISRRTFLIGAGSLAMAAYATGPSISAPMTKFRPRGGADVSHSAFDGILGRAVKPDGQGYNRVDYRALANRKGPLTSYVAYLQQQKPSEFSAKAAHAYWINLYNAKTLEVVADHYPVKSIKRINLGGGGLFGSGPWSKKIVTVEGTPLSLDDIEHDIVRALFGDPMSHYALNCASYSCPNIATRAYTAGNLDAQMRHNAIDYVNHRRGIDARGGNLAVSKIYSWYASDFGGSGNLKKHWVKFADGELQPAIRSGRISRYVYDWTLNDI